eukprot:5327515-Amphidinium_carterae.1
MHPIVRHTEPLEAHGAHKLYILIARCCQHCAAARQHGELEQAEPPLRYRGEARVLEGKKQARKRKSFANEN